MTGWRDLAACKGLPTEWWYPSRGDLDNDYDRWGAVAPEAETAREVCASCPVREPCLEEGLGQVSTQRQGIWGGVNVSSYGNRRSGRWVAHQKARQATEDELAEDWVALCKGIP